MDFTLSEHQEAVVDLAGRLFADRAGVDQLRTAEASDDRIDTDLWRRLADAGLLGLAVPAEHGGAGMGLVELCLLLEQQGRRLAPVPLWPTLVLGALAVTELGSTAQRSAWLPGVVSGEVVLSAALSEPGLSDPRQTSITARRDGGAWRLDGVKVSVPAAHVAGAVIVPARTGDGDGLFLLAPVSDGVTVERAATTDRSIVGHLTMDGARAEPLGEGGPAPGLDWLVDRALVGLCALALGVAEEGLASTAAFTSSRLQFGRPLSTNQAVAQRAADGYIDVSAMRVTMLEAAWRLAESRPAGLAVETAACWGKDGVSRVVHAVQHLHGGLGADVEYPIHRYFLWGKQIETTLGAGSLHLDRLGELVAEGAI